LTVKLRLAFDMLTHQLVLSIPMLKRASRMSADSSTTNGPTARAAAADLRILVVEDNRDTAESLRLLLGTYGYRPSIAPDGPTALSMADRERPDVVFLDIGLPGMDGYEVARRLRSAAGDRSPLLVAVSGHGETDDRKKADDAGIHEHLLKPADPVTLLALLDRFGEILFPQATSQGGCCESREQMAAADS
jgi:CheY-like chemotaxis protein